MSAVELKASLAAVLAENRAVMKEWDAGQEARDKIAANALASAESEKKAADLRVGNELVRCGAIMLEWLRDFSSTREGQELKDTRLNLGPRSVFKFAIYIQDGKLYEWNGGIGGSSSAQVRDAESLRALCSWRLVVVQDIVDRIRTGKIYEYIAEQVKDMTAKHVRAA